MSCEPSASSPTSSGTVLTWNDQFKEKLADELVTIFSSSLQPENFESAQAYSCLKCLATMAHVDNGEKDDSPPDVDPEYLEAVGKITNGPAVKAAAVEAYGLVKDYVDDCSQECLSQLDDQLSTLAEVVTLTLQAWTDYIAANTEAKERPELPLRFLNKVWGVYNESIDSSTSQSVALAAGSNATLQEFVGGLFFCLKLIFIVIGKDCPGTDQLCAAWMGLVLAQNCVCPSDEATRDSISNCLSLPVLSLFINDQFPFCANRLAGKECFQNSLAVGGLLVDERRGEICRKLIDWAVVSPHNGTKGLLCVLCERFCRIGWDLERGRSEIAGVPADRWWVQVSPGSDISVTPLLAVAHLLLKPLAPFLAMHSAKLTDTNAAAKQLQTAQKAAMALLLAILDNVPPLNWGRDALQAHVQHFSSEESEPAPDQILDGSTVGQEDEQADEDEDSDPDMTPGRRKPTKPKGPSRKELQRKAKIAATKSMLTHLRDHLPGLIAQVIFLAPDRRELRDRVTSLLGTLLSRLQSCPSSATAALECIMMLARLTTHDRSGVRILAVELLGALAVEQTQYVLTALQPLCVAPILARVADVQPTVRSRALDVLSQVLGHVVVVLTVLPSPLEEIAMSVNGQLRPAVELLREWALGTAMSANRLDWNLLIALVDLRLQDGKSMVRKSAVNLLEQVCMLTTIQDNDSVGISVADFLNEEIIFMLVDDVALTVRQRTVQLLNTLLYKLTDSLTRTLGLKGLCRLCLDNEEAINSKSLESLATGWLASLPIQLKQFVKQDHHQQGGLSVNVSSCDVEFSDVQLAVIALEEVATEEVLFRILSVICRTRVVEVVSIVKSINDYAKRARHLPRGILALLNMCLEVGSRQKPDLWHALPSGFCERLIDDIVNSGALCGESNGAGCSNNQGEDEPITEVDSKGGRGAITEDTHGGKLRRRITRSEVHTCHRSMAVALKTAALLSPAVLSDGKRVALRDYLLQCIEAMKIPAMLVQSVLTLYFLLMETPQEYRAAITRLAQMAKKTIGLLSRPDADISPVAASVAFQTAGFCYIMASRLSPSNKICGYLNAIAYNVASVQLGIANNAFKNSRGSIRTDSGEHPWLEDVPEWLQCVALTSACQVMLHHDATAKQLITYCVKAGISNARLLANLAVGVYDFSIKTTSLVDPFFTLVSSQMSPERSPPFVRCQILALLAQLCAQDYLKPKGLILYHMLACLGDPHSQVRSLAEQVVLSVILPRVRDLVVCCFLETACFVHGFTSHPAVPLAVCVHPLAKRIVSTPVFDPITDQASRFRIYSFLLSTATDHNKHELSLKILEGFIRGFIPGEAGHREQNVIPPPPDASTPAGRVLRDLLSVLSCADIQITFTAFGSVMAREAAAAVAGTVVGASRGVVDGIPREEGDEADAEEQNRERTGKINKHLLQTHLAKNVLPVLRSLRRVLMQNNSALQKDINECLARLLFDWQDQLADLVGDDTQLCQMLQRMFSEAGGASNSTTSRESQLATAQDQTAVPTAVAGTAGRTSAGRTGRRSTAASGPTPHDPGNRASAGGASATLLPPPTDYATATFEEVFLMQNLQAKFARKELLFTVQQQLNAGGHGQAGYNDGGLDSMRSSLLMGSTPPLDTALTIHSATPAALLARRSVQTEGVAVG